MNANDLIKLRMDKRLEKFYKPIALILGESYERYWVAGSSCNKDKPNDFDVYSEKNFDFVSIADNAENMNIHVVSTTKNAITVIINEIPVQFCNYSKSCLEMLIDSFDFAHVQVGVEIINNWEDGEYENSKVFKTCMTEDYQNAMIIGNTWYTGSEYPLSSMIRLVKYVKRDLFIGNSYKISQLKILEDIVTRGFEDYGDFKDQMEAIDLRLLDEDESDVAYNLYKSFECRGLVKIKKDE